MSILELKNVSYAYKGGDGKVLNGVNASFEKGIMYAVMGKSGAGKSTLLSLISGLDLPTEGEILFDGTDLKTVSRDAYRAKSIGVIFQSFNLLTNATVIDNIILSMNISGVKGGNKEAAYALLEKVGIDKSKANRKVLKLSGGEQQRVGIARALSHAPDIIIADEPSGNLDGSTEDSVMQLFKDLAVKDNKCVIIVTHSKNVAACADEVLSINNGVLSPMKRSKLLK
ncbi:MAG: ABC transporter ATP-binding protein [Christensenellaceae bacterium]|jgi:putative ABC transport system ATP-binding protein|nr:ABC transporter ATP-binding protein [Christensenellaceae bacterium]